jgi:GNAT superfamily N-acetyltransferase
MPCEVTLRVASASDYRRIEASYAAWGYRGGVLPQDIVYVAEQECDAVAAVRRTREHGFVLLRGMYVAPERQRRGIGSRLLDFFVSHLDRSVCYCVPYVHLRAFYGRAGFVPLDHTLAPAFLRERLVAYRARGLDVLVMRRSVPNSTRRSNPYEGCQVWGE